MDSIKKHLMENRWYYLLWAGACAAFCLIVFPLCSAEYISYDSSYQYFLTQHSFADIMRLLPEDYSPPFYALSLKLYTMIFGNSLFVMRTYNLVAAAGMFLLAAFPVRRAFGGRAAVYCSVLIFCTDTVYFLLREVRPTYFAMFFVMGAGIYAYHAFFGGGRRDVVLHAVFSLLAMYTHNIGMLSALAIYVVLLMFAALRRDLAAFKRFFCSGVCCAVLYVPWLIVVLGQFANVREGFWTSLLSGVGELFSWTFAAPFNYSSAVLRMVLHLSIAAVIFVWFVRNIRWKNIHGAKNFADVFVFLENKDACVRAAFLLAMYIMAIAAMLLFSLLVYPLATERYCYVFSGLLFIAIAAAMSAYRIKLIPAVLAAMICVNSFYADYSWYVQLKKSDGVLEELTDLFATAGETPAFLHFHEGTVGILSYYYPDSEHYVCDDTNTVLQTYDVFTTEIKDVGSAEDICSYTSRFLIISAENIMATDGSTAAQMVERYLPDADMQVIGTCTLPYSFVSSADVILVTV